MAHENSSPLAGILMTAFFGLISTILGVITMYQVHSIWVKYHHHHHRQHENQAADIELRNGSVCVPATEEWQETPETSLRAVEQAYANPHHHRELLPSDSIITRCVAGDDEGTFDLALGGISRFSSTDSDSSEEGDWVEGIQAPPSTPESEIEVERYET